MQQKLTAPDLSMSSGCSSYGSQLRRNWQQTDKQPSCEQETKRRTDNKCESCGKIVTNLVRELLAPPPVQRLLAPVTRVCRVSLPPAMVENVSHSLLLGPSVSLLPAHKLFAENRPTLLEPLLMSCQSFTWRPRSTLLRISCRLAGSFSCSFFGTPPRTAPRASCPP